MSQIIEVNTLKKQTEVISVDDILIKYTNVFFEMCHPFSECFGNPENSVLRHLNDEVWISKKLQAKLKSNNINFDQILNFVKSESFAKLKHDYEQRVIKWLITWTLEGRESYISSEEYWDDFIVFHESCDIGFREGIFNKLKEVGIDPESIEEGIEKNSDLWFEKKISSAFLNRYMPVFAIARCDDDEIKSFDPEHKKIWLKVRRYAYYVKHKEAMDKYGSVHPDMKMKEEEVKELCKYLNEKDKERKQYLKELKDAQKESNNQKKIGTNPFE